MKVKILVVLAVLLLCTAFASAIIIDPGVPPGYDPTGYPLATPIHYSFMINSFGEGWTEVQKATVRDAIDYLDTFFIDDPAFEEDPSEDFTIRWAGNDLFKDWGDYGGKTEPFTDTNGNGQWDEGEPFTDLNGNGKRDDFRWDYSETLGMAVKPRDDDSTPWPQETYPYNEIYINSTYKWNMDNGLPADDEYDLWTVTLHEVIHMLCVDEHAADANEVMFEEIDKGQRKTIQDSDLALLRAAGYYEIVPAGPVTVDFNDVPVYEPYDADGPPVTGPTEGQLQVSLGWQPGEPTYPPFTATVTVDPNPNQESVGSSDFSFTNPVPPDPNGNVFLTFTQDNWDTFQNVTIAATADLLREGNESHPVDLTCTINIDDPNFQDKTVTTVVYVIDNDIPSISVLPDGYFKDVLTENNPSVERCVDVTLSHMPHSDVDVIVRRESYYDVLLDSMSVMVPPLGVADDPNRLTFTPGSYNIPQVICLEVRDDDELTEPWLEWVPGLITLNGLSDDIRYQSAEQGGELEETVIYFNVQDNECGAWGYNPMDFNQDCAVNLVDFAHFCVQWLACTDPQDPGCQHAEPL